MTKCARCGATTAICGHAVWSTWGNKPLCPKCLLAVQRHGPTETKPEHGPTETKPDERLALCGQEK